MIDDGDKLALRVGDNQVMFVFEQAILVSRLIEGEYPNYKQIIPNKHNTRVELDVQELADTLKTASIFSLEGSSGVRLSVKPSGMIEVTSESSQLGNFSAKLPAKVEGEGGEISFNAKYLLDGLNSFETPRCIFEMEGKTTPGVFKPSGVEGRLYIVMPLRN
jgi:DNA polymerase III subunit beta